LKKNEKRGGNGEEDCGTIMKTISEKWNFKIVILRINCKK